MNRNTIYILFIASVLVQIANTKEHPAVDEESSKILSSQSGLSPHVEPSSGSNRSDSSRRTFGRSRRWTTLTTESSSSSATSTAKTTPRNKSESEIVHERWKVFERNMKKTINDYMKKAFPTILRMGSSAKLSAECSNGIMALILGVRGMKSWAFRMLDASAKLPAGLLDGTVADFGEYDECLAIEKLDNKKKTQFTGQYCVAKAKFLLPPAPHRVQLKTVVLDFSNFSEPDSVLSDLVSSVNVFYAGNLQFGLCLPSTCSTKDVQEITNLALKDVPLNIEVDRCEVKQPYVFSGLQIASISFIGALVLLAAAGTFIDVKTTSPLDSWNKMYSGIVADSLKCFSVVRNLKKLLKISQSTENFGVINGLRVFTMVWVVLIHTYALCMKGFAVARMKNVADYLDEVTSVPIFTPFVSVDTFFLVGAFLVAHSNLKSLEKDNGHMNFVRYYLHRIWRLTPPVAGGVLVMFLLPLLGSGPVFEDVVGLEVGVCEKDWWRTLIIPILSWTPYDNMCLVHTWYISSDLILYFLAPAIFISLYKWPVIGFMLMVFLTLACMSIVAVLTVLYDFYPTLLFLTPDFSFTTLQMEMLYFRPYFHIGPYCVGLALGYLVLHYRKVDIKPIYQVLGWCAATTCSLTALYGTYDWNRGNLPTKVVEVTFAMFHPTAWAMGIAWLVYMCIVGRGGVINRFLSWNLFIPLGRLSYSAYIIHFPVVWMRNGLRRKIFLFHHYDIIYEFLATFVLTLCLSVTFHLLFEAPFLNLEEVWFPKNGRETKKTSEHEVTKVRITKTEN